MVLNIELQVEQEDLDLLTEFAAKLAAREKDRDEEYQRYWRQRNAASEERLRELEPTEADVAAVEAVLDRAEQETVIEGVAEPEVSEQEATDALHQYVAKHGAAAALSLFAAYGAKRLGEVPSDRRAEVVGKMKEAL